MNNEPRQLLDDTFLSAAYDNYGDSVIDWPELLKDQAVQMAMRNGSRDQLNSIMLDFWANRGLLPLYESKVNEVKNNVYACFEDFLQIDLDDWISANTGPMLSPRMFC